jgi:hypothetical protein
LLSNKNSKKIDGNNLITGNSAFSNLTKAGRFARAVKGKYGGEIEKKGRRKEVSSTLIILQQRIMTQSVTFQLNWILVNSLAVGLLCRWRLWRLS